MTGATGEGDVERILDQLIAWGLAEQNGTDVRPTRRWNARLQAAAEKINLLAAREGRNPAGNPLILAVSQALADENLTLEGEAFRDAVGVLVMLELARIAPSKRAQLGFPDVKFPGE